jgi:hypothetical protein
MKVGFVFLGFKASDSMRFLGENIYNNEPLINFLGLKFSTLISSNWIFKSNKFRLNSFQFCLNTKKQKKKGDPLMPL